MITNRALFREAAQTSLAIIAVLTVLMLFFGLTQTLGLAAMGKRAAQTVFQLVGLETIRALDTLASVRCPIRSRCRSNARCAGAVRPSC